MSSEERRRHPHRRFGGSKVSRGERMPQIHARPGKSHVGPAWTAVSNHAADRLIERFIPDCDRPFTLLYRLGKTARYYGEAEGADVFVHDDIPGAMFLVRGVVRTVISILDMPRTDTIGVERDLMNLGVRPASVLSDVAAESATSRLGPSAAKKVMALDQSKLGSSMYPIDLESSVPVVNIRRFFEQMRAISSAPRQISHRLSKLLRIERTKAAVALPARSKEEPTAWSAVRRLACDELSRYLMLQDAYALGGALTSLLGSLSTGLVCVAHESGADFSEQYVFVSDAGFMHLTGREKDGSFSLRSIVPPLQAPDHDYEALSSYMRDRAADAADTTMISMVSAIASKEVPGTPVLHCYLNLTEENLTILDSFSLPNPFHDMSEKDVRMAVDRLLVARLDGQESDPPWRSRARLRLAKIRLGLPC